MNITTISGMNSASMVFLSRGLRNLAAYCFRLVLLHFFKAPSSGRIFTIIFNPGKPKAELEKRTARLQITNNDNDENPYMIDLVGYIELD